MPVKFSKAFGRRKSAGNVLEPQEPQSGGSFRVLDRTEIADRKAAAVIAAERDESRRFSLRRLSNGRPLSSPSLLTKEDGYEYDNPKGSDRESGRTNNSSSIGSNSTTRLSYTSTNPSSVDSINDITARPFADHPKYVRHGSSPAVTTQRNTQPRPHVYSEPDDEDDDEELFGPPFAVKAGGRTFSFGSRADTAAQSTPGVTRSARDTPRVERERAGTASSYASTATPQNTNRNGNPMAWEDSDFGVGGLNIAREGRRLPDLPTPPAPVARSESDSMLEAKSGFPLYPSQSQPILLSNRLEKSPPPTHSFSPRSFDSRGSEDAFLPPPGGAQDSRRSSPQPEDFSRRDSSSSVEPDDQLVLDAVYASQALEFELGPMEAHPLPEPPRFENQHLSATPPPLRTSSKSPPAVVSPQEQTPRAQTRPGLLEERPVLRPTERRYTGPSMTGKVMTPAEFARLRNQQNGNDDDSEGDKSENDDEDEDEDETERARQAAKQRKRQEAHLAVYRQQMRKVTGDKSQALADSATSRASQSTPNLFADSPALDLKLGGSTNEKVSDDSDDDVPLGVLQAHGFPSKTRAPNRLSSSASPGLSTQRSVSQLSSYPAPVGSTRNDPSAGGGGNGTGLPAFARHLPQDPYVGASLVNASNREAPAQPNSVASNAQGGQPSGPLPPGGLVGVIAGEERARAMRRGSPNTNGTYGQVPPQIVHPAQAVPQHMQGQPPAMQMPNQPNVMPYPQQTMYQTEQSQADLSNSMTQMMQMQMQWMQQMMQMNGMQVPPQMQMNGMPMPPQMQMGQPYPSNHLAQPQQEMRPGSALSQATGNPHARRTSTMSQAGPFRHGYNNSFGSNGPMSMMTPSAASIYNIPAPNHGYAPSIAPSERSTVGQPSRYRPVNAMGSSMDLNKNSRTSTMSMSTSPAPALPGLNINRSRSPPKQPLAPIQNLPSTIRAFSKPKHGGGASDDEDEEGWASLKKKREERKGKWREKKAMPPLNPTEGLEALYYNQ